MTITRNLCFALLLIGSLLCLLGFVVTNRARNPPLAYIGMCIVAAGFIAVIASLAGFVFA